jgi:ABC-type sugar transport system ATPase subunit
MKKDAVEVVRMESICKSFPGVQALNDVNFSGYRGEIHALVGENGAGKSTLIKILGGVFQPDSGNIILKGKEIAFKSTHAARMVGISAVHQELVLVPYLSVAENILLGQEDCNKLGILRSLSMRQAVTRPLHGFQEYIPKELL